MNINLVGTIPMKPHLEKYVRRIENLSPGEAIDLTGVGIIRITLRHMLTRKSIILEEESTTSYKNFEATYSAKLRYRISERMQTFSEFYLSKASIIYFNRFVHTLLHEELLIKIMEGITRGEKEKDIIYDFMRQVEIDELVSFDTLKRASTRLRNAKKIGTIHQQKRPVA